MTTSSDSPKSDNLFVADVNSGMTMAWLLNIDTILNKGMGGTLAEQSDLSGVRDILDIACGPGGWVLEVAREHAEFRVTGIDISEPMVRYAQALAESRGFDNATFQVMDATKPLNFDDNSFDLVNARTLFGFMSPALWPQLLKECQRIMRPGGIIRFTELEAPVTTSPALTELWDLSASSFYVMGRSFSRDGRHIGTTPVLRRLLREAGYQHIRHKAHAFDMSSGSEDFEGIRQNFMIVFTLVRAFLIRSGVTTEEKYDPLYQRMLAEMLADDFSGIWYYLTVYGTNP